MKVFAKQIVAKIRNGPGLEKETTIQIARSYPRRKDFLYVVDIEDDMVKVCMKRVILGDTIENLYTFVIICKAKTSQICSRIEISEM